MITYRSCNCARRHRTYRTFAKCIWAYAGWIDGEGPYALLARCDVLTITLHADVTDAEEAKRAIDYSGCGGKCARLHQIIQLSKEPDR